MQTSTGAGGSLTPINPSNQPRTLGTALGRFQELNACLVEALSRLRRLRVNLVGQVAEPEANKEDLELEPEAIVQFLWRDLQDLSDRIDTLNVEISYIEGGTGAAGG